MFLLIEGHGWNQFFERHQLRSDFPPKNHIDPLSNHEQKARKIHASSSTFLNEHPSKKPGATGASLEKNSKSPSLSTVKMDKDRRCPGGDLQRFYPSEQTHNQTNLIEPDVELFMNVTHQVWFVS